LVVGFDGRKEVRVKTIRILAAAMVLGACTHATLAVPPELSGGTQLQVTGRTGSGYDERIRFGTFATDRVNRSWTDRQITPGIISRQRYEWQDYRFRLMEDSATFASESCRANAAADVQRLPGGTQLTQDRSGRLDCTITPPDSSQTWRMQLRADVQGRLRGTLSGGGRGLAVEGSTPLGTDRGCCLSAGYYLRDGDGRTLAAVETIRDGTVWLAPNLSHGDRRLAAAAAAALLAYEPLGYYY
jgi:hypothetical protein